MKWLRGVDSLKSPSKPVLALEISLVFISCALYILVSRFQKDFCPRIHTVGAEQIRHKRSEKGFFHAMSNITKDWGDHYDTVKEVDVLSDDTPVLEVWSRSANASYTHRLKEGIAAVTDKITEAEIAREITKVKGIYEEGHDSRNDSTRSTDNKTGLLLCKDIAKLESAEALPRMQYTSGNSSVQTGLLSISGSSVHSILIKRVTITNPSEFDGAKKDVMNLLKAYGWYGAPRLYGLCMTSNSGNDVIEDLLRRNGSVTEKKEQTAIFMSYVMSRHDRGLQLCDTNRAGDSCKRLSSVVNFARSNKRPAVATLTIMRNTAILFEQFWKYGVVQYDLNPTHFYVGSQFEVTLTDLAAVTFLPMNSHAERSNFQRLLSGTTCKKSKECPSATWVSDSVMYQYGQHCEEIKGFCSVESYCWGVDSLTHSCVLSRWFFGRLHLAVPAFWSHDGELTRLLQCASKSFPYERCNWSDLRIGLDKLLEFAEKEWP